MSGHAASNRGLSVASAKMDSVMTDASRTHPAAVLWDLDGTLVDSEPLWFAAEAAFLESHGGTWSDALAHELIGSALPASARRMIAALAAEGIVVEQSPDQVVEQMVDAVAARLAAGEVVWRPGAPALLADLRAARVPCALVSMSYRRLLEVVVEQLPAGSFAAIVAGDEVTHGKPHPEPYLTAARRLGVPIGECIVIEDSPTGAAAGVASGAMVVAVRNLVPVDPGGRSVVLDTLEGVGAAELFAMARSA